MLLIDNPYTNPYFNIALEEHLIKQFRESVFMLYCNAPSVIVGKHQNTLAEINKTFVRKYQIPVVRRISGGGTVYHDQGNLNYSSILTAEKGKMVDFKRYARPVQQVLSDLGIPAYFAKNNSLFTNGLKISGNAEHIFKQRVLHHGTLLFNADLERLNESLKVDGSVYQSRAVQSIRSKVANISALLAVPLTLDDFKKRIFDAVQGDYPGAAFYALTHPDIKAVNKLVQEKYRTDAWNYGYSPNYTFKRAFREYPFDLRISLKVEKGIIAEAYVLDQRTGLAWERMMQILQNLPHQPDAIEQALRNNFAATLSQEQCDTLLQGLIA